MARLATDLKSRREHTLLLLHLPRPLPRRQRSALRRRRSRRPARGRPLPQDGRAGDRALGRLQAGRADRHHLRRRPGARARRRHHELLRPAGVPQSARSPPPRAPARPPARRRRPPPPLRRRAARRPGRPPGRRPARRATTRRPRHRRARRPRRRRGLDDLRPTTIAPDACPPALPPGTNPGGGQVGLLLISRYVTPNSLDQVDTFNHYSLLKSIEDLFALRPLGYARDSALPVFDAAIFNAAKP